MQKHRQKYKQQLRVISRLFLVVYIANILFGKDINFYAQKLAEFDAGVYSKVHTEQIYICGHGTTDTEDYEKLIYANKLVKNTLLFSSVFLCVDDAFMLQQHCVDKLATKNVKPIVLAQNNSISWAVFFHSRAPPMFIV